MTILWSILAIICILSGVTILSIRTGSLFYLFWFGAGIFFLFLAVAARFHWWSLLPGKVRVAILSLCGAGLLCFCVVEGCIISQFSQRGNTGLKYIVVLGAQVHESAPSIVLRYRLDTAVDYLKKNQKTVCIVSGGQGNNEPRPEAEVMAEYLKAHGISEERILLEAKSATTAENIAFSKKLMKDEGSVGVVTNNFHVFRALQIARSNGLEDVSGIAAPSSLLYLPNNMIREFFAEAKYLLF